MGILRYACPKCGEAFPWRIPRRQRVGKGAKLSCSNCGQISRVKVSIKNALWSWPLTVVFLLAFIPFLGKLLGSSLSVLLRPLIDVYPALYAPALYAIAGGALGGIILGLIIGLTLAIALRRGMEVVKADEREGPPSRGEKIQK